MRIYLIRHGETDWNADKRIQGHTDIPLNETGRAQAQLIADRLAGAHIAAIYTSDFQRATDTAKAIHAKHPDIPFVIEPQLRERNWGLIEGLHWAEIERDFPGDIVSIKSGDAGYEPSGGGESKNAVIARGIKLMAEIEAAYPGGNVVCVTHGGVTTALLKHALGVPQGVLTPFLVENCALHVIDIKGDRWYVRTLNDMSHLPGK